MSYSSEYMKLREQRNGNALQDAGGSIQPAYSEGATGAADGTAYEQEYLQLRQQRNSGTIGERVEARVQEIQGAIDNARSAKGISPRSYYSRPTMGENSEKLMQSLTGIQLEMAKKTAEVDQAKESLLQRQNDLQKVLGFLDQAKAAYDSDPSEETAESYNAIAGAYDLAYQLYSRAYGVYSAAYDNYKPYEDRMVNALVDYRLYMNQQKNAYNDWRGTIRDADIIRQDLDNIEIQIAQLERQEQEQRNAQAAEEQAAKPWYAELAGYLGAAKDTTLPAGTMPGGVVPENSRAVSPEMQALLDKKALLQEEYGWSQYFPYADLADAPDFKEKSQYVSTANGQERSAMDIMMGNYSGGAPWDDPLYEYINGNEEAGAYISNAAANSYGPDNAIGSAFGRATESKTESQQMTDQEIATFNYLYATQGKEAAHQYYNYLQSDLNYRQRKADEGYWANYAAESPIAASVFSWAMAPTKGMSYLGQTADYLTGGEIDQNAGYNKFSYAGSAIRGQVAKQIEESGKWGKAGSFAYQTAMSMADFLLNTAITGGNQNVTLAIMGTGAAADATIEAKDRGLTDDQAFALGTIAGIAEAITEKVSLETLLNPDLLKNGAVKYILKNMLAEGSEEVGSDIINLFADVLISKDKSEWQQSMAGYIAEGKTPNEAFGLAAADQAAEMGLDFLGGILSGGFMSGGNAAIHVNFTRNLGKELGKLNLSEEDVKAFIETGLESDQETASYQIAQELQKKLDAGKKLSNYDLSRLYQANILAVEEENSRPAAAVIGDDRGTQNGTESQQEIKGLSLPTLEEDTQENRAGQVAAQQGAQRNGPISVAERLRQEQNQNGGIQNVRTSEQGQQLTAGAGILDGGQERNAGTGAAEQAGGLETGAIQQSSTTVDQRRAIVARQNLARHLRLEKTSSKELGLQNGTEAKTIQVMPQEHWDGEMKTLADRLYNETGKNVVYVMGRIQIRGAGGNVGYVRGVFSGDRIVLQADNLRVPIEKIADHEAYHAKVDFAGKAGLNQEIKRHIINTFSKEQFKKVLDKYIVAMRGVYNVSDAASPEEFVRVMKLIEEEIFADAYAGINAFDAHADQFTEAVNKKMDQLMLGKQNQENGAKQETGPPVEAGQTEERYSYEETEQELRGLSLPTLESGQNASQYSLSQDREGDNAKIYPGMDDAERARILAQKEIRVPAFDSENPVTGAQIIKLKGKYTSEAKKLIRMLADNCGVFDRDFTNADIDLEFQYSRGSLSESISKQPRNRSGAEEFGMMLTVLPQICRDAVEIEAHTDKYVETKRADNRLKEMHVFLGAFTDGEYTIPVQMEIKEYKPGTGMENKLYMTVTLKRTEAGIKPRGYTANASVSNHGTPASTINVADLIANVKDDTGNLVKYLPDEMLNEEQKQAKAEALARDAKRLGDMKYEYAVERGDTEKAERLLRDKAAEKGYEAGNDWRMAHRAPNPDSGVALPNADAVYGADGSIYTPAAGMYYGEGRSYDGKALVAFNKARNKPGAMITVYRAVPSEVQDAKLRNGDWVTPTREYASEHGEMYFDGDYRIIKETVPAKYLYVNGDSIHEFGYDNGRANELYKNTRNNVKLSGVTYDDQGRLIPLSSRYDETISDERYSMDDTEQQQAGTEGELDPEKLEEQWKEEHKKDKETWLKEQMGEEGYKAYKEQKRQKAQERGKKKPEIPKSRPITAKRQLRQTVLNLFSIPSGQRAELGTMIDNYADRLIKNGTLTEDDRKAFFDRMYESGVMTVPANDYYAEARSYMEGGRIYVADSVVKELGDDWNDIRRRAFAAGIYLTRTRMSNNVENMGIDVWNDNLASDLPGLFDSEETDQRSILERIIQVAEEGMDEKMSLPEYTAWLAETEHQSEDEFLDNMERQMDYALRAFAEKADLEVKLRDKSERMLAAEREARKEAAERATQRKQLQELQQKTLKQLQWLSKNRNRAPEELRTAWDEVLGDIDIYAVSAANEMMWSDKYNATWRDLAQMYKDAKKNDPNFLPSEELEKIVARLDGTKIGDMDIDALNDLYKAAIGLRTEFYNRNNVINDEQKRLFAEVYADSKREIEAAPGKYTGNPMDKLFNLEQLTPMNVLQRMGGWDPDGAFYSMAKQLERGERDIRAYKVKAQRMLQEFLTEHEEWVKKADGQGKDGIWYEIEVPELLELGMGDKPIFGDTVTVYMTPAQKVHMYLESKSYDNLRHMTGGRTFADKALYSDGKRQEAFAQGKTIRLAPETVRKLVSNLTAEEMELAKVLEQYYNSFATKEINEVSNVLYGYDKAMGKNYAPIYTNRNYTKAEFGIFDQTAEGVGNLKGRVFSKNPSYNISAFDAFERHVDQTARFCGMAIPARNWTTFMNWRERNNSTGDVITHKWGDEGKKYITDLITRLQSGSASEGETVSKTVEKIMSNYISATFGANPGIVLKQLGSIPLAAAYLDPRNIPSVAQIRSIDRELISKYTQDLEWRTMGYSMPETKQLKDNPNWAQSNKVFGFFFGGEAITAMDGWAASTLWPWAENKVRREFPNLEVGTRAQIENGESPFYKKVAEEFETAVARSQSTSDEIHQSILRKSKNPFTKAFTMFRSDSAQTYNAIRQMIGEAQYYAKTGKDPGKLRAAKRKVGAAVVSAIAGYMWAEAVDFLMNLWKHKGKKYRDDDDELTAQSVMGEMVSGLIGDLAGVVVGGEELYDFVGGIITDGNWFGIDTMGMEQLNDCLEAVFEAGKTIRDIVADGKDILENGGDLGDYFIRHGSDMLGGIKDIAKAAATYFPGLPVNNLEAYLLGVVKWVSPELETAYEDLMKTADKNGLSGLEGDALTGRIGSILDNRRISQSDDTAQILAELYASGYKQAVPGDTPTSVSINGESRKLGAYQQQTYDAIWGSVVADALDDMVTSDAFTSAGQEAQAKMLSNLYTYAAERAKAELFDDFEMDSTAAKNAEIVKAGASIAECITWNTITSGMKSGEKAAELAAWNIPEKAKRSIFRNKITDSREDTITEFQNVGLSFDQFLRAYSKYNEINNLDMKASEKAVEFSRWVNGQGYSAVQSAVVRDQLTYFSMTPASAGRYDELVSAGMDPEDAYKLMGTMNALEPEEGKISVSDIQRWRACVDFSDDANDQLTALSAVMDDKQFVKVKIAYSFSVEPEAYVRLQEIKYGFDADGNEYLSNNEIKAAINSMSGLTTKQRAALWQLATGSTSARRNPYDGKVGQQVIDAREKAKENADSGAGMNAMGDDESFQQAFLNQLLGRG